MKTNCLLLSLCLSALSASSIIAQDEATPAAIKEAATESAADTSQVPQAAWTKLLQRRRTMYGELLKLQKEFAAAASSDDKRRIRDTYTDLLTEFDVEIYPGMLELAPEIYRNNADDLDAGEIVMKSAFNANDFDRSADISSKLIAAGRESRDVLSMAGVSQFAVHNFEQAHTILSKAKEQNRLDPLYESYVDASQEYIEFWKTEQEVRAKEAELEGDQALPRAEFETNRGKIVFELFEDEAPNTVANFVSLIEGGKYDGIKFHRYEPTFMIQGGDANTLDDDPRNDGQGSPGYTIKCECYADNARRHFRGSLSMAKTALPDTGGSQFFITHLPTHWLNAVTEPQKNGHTVFGRVIEGLEIATSLRKGDVIQKATVLRKRSHEYKPEVTDETTEFPKDPTE
jgi:cyclophilin family peptidyl-prolyl cis-trans isomerase